MPELETGPAGPSAYDPIYSGNFAFFQSKVRTEERVSQLHWGLWAQVKQRVRDGRGRRARWHVLKRARQLPLRCAARWRELLE